MFTRVVRGAPTCTTLDEECHMPGFKKTECPISREQFAAQAKPVEVRINGVPLLAEVKEFSTGSLGWYLSGKVTLPVGDTAVSTQIGLNLTIANSKELPKTPAKAVA